MEKEQIAQELLIGLHKQGHYQSENRLLIHLDNIGMLESKEIIIKIKQKK